MDTTNKIFLAVALSLLAIAAAVYIISPKTTGFAATGTQENNEDVKLGTFAVCEQKDNYTVCKDKIFASCNKQLLEINDTIFYCNGKKYNASSLPLGETYHIQNWSDPRQKDFITAWASSE